MTRCTSWAASYKKPVAIHTGATAGSNALLKYSHPLTLDEAAVAHPDVQFVMCHIGNPFLMDAAAVLEKNGNMGGGPVRALEAADGRGDLLPGEARTWRPCRPGSSM